MHQRQSMDVASQGETQADGAQLVQQQPASKSCTDRAPCCCCGVPRWTRCPLCLLITYLVCMPLVYFIGHTLVYPGDDYVSNTPNCEETSFPFTDGSSVPAIQCPWGSTLPGVPTTPVLVFGGNGMNMYDSAYDMRSVLPTDRSWMVYSMSLPGSQYAPRKGWTSQGRALEDGQALLRYVSGKTGQKVVVFGWSLGSSLAAGVSATVPDLVQCTLLGNPFTSIRDVAMSWTYSAVWPYLYLFDRWPTQEWAGTLSAPTIVMSSTRDAVIPVAMHTRVYTATGAQKKKLFEKSTSHMDIFGFSDLVEQTVKDWCAPSQPLSRASALELRRRLEPEEPRARRRLLR